MGAGRERKRYAVALGILLATLHRLTGFFMIAALTV